MFSTLSSYIWSSGSEDQTVPDLTEDNLLERGEDEWILVDIVNEKASDIVNEKPSVKSDEIETVQKVRQAPQPAPRSIDILEESWYVTPPSCFNASQEDSLSLQTSPLENLLIEHPSMSVYGGPTEAWLTVEQSPTEENSEENPDNETPGDTALETRTHTHRRGVRTANKAEQLTRHVQKNLLEQTQKQYRKKKLQKQNQTHVRVTRSRRKQKKVDRKQSKHSTVYSNRGC